MAVTQKQKREGAARYSWSPGKINIRKATERVGFHLPYDMVVGPNFNKVLEEISRATRVAVDSETTSLDPDKAKLCCISFCLGATSYVAYAEHSVTAAVLPREMFIALVRALLKVRVWIWWNGNYDLRILRNTLPEIDLDEWYSLDKRMVDAQGLVFLSDTNIWTWTLKQAAKFFLGVNPPEFDTDYLGEAIFLQPINELTYYSAFDAWDTYWLFQLFYPEMKKHYTFPVVLDPQLIWPFIEFEENEIPIDWSVMDAYGDQVAHKIEQTKESFFSKFGVINLGSNDQKGELLRKLGFDTKERTEGGSMRVRIKDLEKLKDRSEAAALMIEFAKLQKMQSSYISPMLERREYNLPIRFKYRQYRVPTYRMAAGSYSATKKGKIKNMGFWAGINIQSAPKPKAVERRFFFDEHTETIRFDPHGDYEDETGSDALTFRKAFAVADDEDWISTDFSGQELVVVANISGEQEWIDAFNRGEDLHKKMAIAIWGEAAYDKNKRKMAKQANFGIIYGGTEYTLMQNLGISMEQATFIIAQMKAAVPRLFQWIEEVHREARQYGYLINAYGLPRQLAPYYRMGFRWQGFADRSSVNTQVQSCGSMIIRMALRKIWEKLREPEFKGKVRFMVTVHDEVNFIAKKAVRNRFLEELDKILLSTSRNEWVVKAGVQHSIGRNWAETLPIRLVRGAEGQVVGILPQADRLTAEEMAKLDAKAAGAPDDVQTIEVEDFVLFEQDEEGIGQAAS